MQPKLGLLITGEPTAIAEVPIFALQLANVKKVWLYWPILARLLRTGMRARRLHRFQQPVEAERFRDEFARAPRQDATGAFPQRSRSALICLNLNEIKVRQECDFATCAKAALKAIEYLPRK